MTSVKLLTSYDDTFAGMALLTFPRGYEYAETWGMNCNETHIKRLTHYRNFDRPASWSKIDILLEQLFAKNDAVEYDWFVWIDADACIMNQQFDLRAYLDAIPKDVWLVLGSDTNGINCGVMLVRNCKEAEEFFTEVWNRTEFINHVWWEQAAVQAIVNEKFNCIPCIGTEATQHYPYNLYVTTGAAPKAQIIEIRNAPFNAYDPIIYSTGTYKKGDFILHCPGLPIQQRIEVIKRRLREYDAPATH